MTAAQWSSASTSAARACVPAPLRPGGDRRSPTPWCASPTLRHRRRWASWRPRSDDVRSGPPTSAPSLRSPSRCRGWWSARPAPGCPTSPTSTASTCARSWPTPWRPLPTVVANDAHLALLGEACEGAAAGRRDALLLAIGTGIGSAVLADGRIQRGSQRRGVLVRLGVRRHRRRRRRPPRLARAAQRRAGARRRRRG